jgi:hypothetical protein
MFDKTEHDLSELFDDKHWYWYSFEERQQLGISSNMLAYSEAQGIYCLILKPSRKGGDYAYGTAGENYLNKALEKGRKDGKPVRQCLVVQVQPDPHAKHPEHPYKIVHWATVQETRERIAREAIPLEEGRLGPFYWISPGNPMGGQFNTGDDLN